MTRTSVFVSTAIPYVNAAPHLGFALEIILADAFARHARARGAAVHFVSGTDDNSLKNVRAAEAAGLSPRAFVDAHAAHYRDLQSLLGASFDDFVRTSADPRHVEAVHALWEACARAGDLEKRTYQGLYCVGCEAFYEASELVGGTCPEHGTAPEVVEEENWFFRLSRYQAPIAEALASGKLRIHPPWRGREIATFVAGGLRDVSVSRSRTRARGWGIAVPGDPDQVIYVWFDALAYYLTSGLWTGTDRRIQVVGKGIARFHAVLWPALLLAAGLPLPTDLCVHGYLTVRGRKIGKSAGNGIAPQAVVSRYGADALRYFLLRHVGPVQDADVDEDRLTAVYTSELADALGNLVSRTLGLVRRIPRGAVPDEPDGDALSVRARALEKVVDDACERLAPDEALRAIWTLVAAANKHLADGAPWAAPSACEAWAILHPALTAIEAIGRALVPFLPSTAEAIERALENPTAAAPVLFPKTVLTAVEEGSCPPGT
ncbi:methionine--tRNA ligase [Pendulispora rubella]|uniref:Methionine--tRNA ligase n=1 Tax=Pendulispora rubella TaxID=2741070 RepID=A0ABZ2LGV4_9BACT